MAKKNLVSSRMATFRGTDPANTNKLYSNYFPNSKQPEMSGWIQATMQQNISQTWR